MGPVTLELPQQAYLLVGGKKDSLKYIFQIFKMKFKELALIKI